ncbi:helix-turn-helix domain-containing protein [Micromonospora sp. WMMD1102]|uniref:helix-turn-helix domain-containing protein n=1 Tax=Micromonospora sp. WMMD1102 TaxID=3016105 RepID=UPI002414FF55|nr:helix-turn-helix domain-containing protein [Micromonospora sp. WMMD1102]MDG4788077.1 helix-turn-helix domain-containing protein [Micromonospora sp. WMMD1102]
MTRHQVIARPAGPLSRDVLIGLLAQLGEKPPTTVARTPNELRAAILAAADRHPTWTSRELAALVGGVSASTVRRYLSRRAGGR